MNELWIVLFGLTMLYVCASSRVESYVKALSFQGVLLFLMLLPGWQTMAPINFWFLVFETLAVKAVLIPWFLFRVIRRNELYREIEPYLSNFSSLVVATGIFAVGFLVAFWSGHTHAGVHPLFFGVALSTMFTGLFVIVTRKKLITHVLGFLMFENGVFMLSLSVAAEMPLVVNIGVLLDIFVGIFLLGLFVGRIYSDIDEDHIDGLSRLKD